MTNSKFECTRRKTLAKKKGKKPELANEMGKNSEHSENIQKEGGIHSSGIHSTGGVEKNAGTNEQKNQSAATVRRWTKNLAARLPPGLVTHKKGESSGTNKVTANENVGEKEPITSEQERVRKGKMKRNELVDESDSDFEVKKPSKRTKRPNTSRKSGKVNKQTKNKTKNNTDVGHIKVRSSPKPLFTAIRSMNKNQKDCLERLGFGAFVDFNIDTLPWHLGFFVVDNFDDKKMMIKMEKGSIKLTKKAVFDILGVPLGGRTLDQIEKKKRKDKTVVKWREQFESADIAKNEVMNRIVTSEVADWYFVLNFLVLFTNTMGKTKQRGKCDLDILRYFTSEEDLRRVDWCDYIYNCAKGCKADWKKDNKNSCFAGPITLLMLLYVDGTEWREGNVNRRRPVITNWSTELLKEREKVGSFDKAIICKPYVAPADSDDESDDESEEGTEGEVPVNNEQGQKTEEVYTERLGGIFNKLVEYSKELFNTSKEASVAFENNEHFGLWNDKASKIYHNLKDMNEKLNGKDEESG